FVFLVMGFTGKKAAQFKEAYIAAFNRMEAELTKPKKTTVDQRTPLRDAVNLLVNKKGLMYQEAYSIVHQRFCVESIDALPPEQLPIAIEYVHRL
ncbi:Rha family transcriptional regulator, partial [Proteus mirabilis]|uniref:Rha family transcriptional regulator n=1 Tax=Proteus mirabilis TaxID=584 RepID=UPI003F1A8333